MGTGGPTVDQKKEARKKTQGVKGKGCGCSRSERKKGKK
jgi:hypothetical protein